VLEDHAGGDPAEALQHGLADRGPLDERDAPGPHVILQERRILAVQRGEAVQVEVAGRGVASS
jgi:hypothetical protein